MHIFILQCALQKFSICQGKENKKTSLQEIVDNLSVVPVQYVLTREEIAMPHNSQKNTERITNAAVALFKRKGYYAVSINEICKEAGIARSSFYDVFPGKRDIITHLLSVYEQDPEGVLQDFVRAKNDFERMWCLCERDIRLAEELGPALTKVILSMELNESIGLYDTLKPASDWLITLMGNAQTAGIIRCPTPPKIMVPIANDLILQVVFDWCRCGGAFSLRERARFYVENVYDVAPAYRRTAG